MVDGDGPYVAERFYKEMLKRDGNARQRHTRAARALWKVMRAMKKERFPLDRQMRQFHAY